MTAHHRESLSTILPGPAERRLAAAIILGSTVAFFFVIPVGRLPLPRVPAFIPTYQAALFLCDLLTAALIAWQMAHTRSKALLVLAAGYVFDALILVPHALTFPGAFTAGGLLGAGPQTTIWLYMLWHGVFPLFVMAYARLDRTQVKLSGSLLRSLLLAVGGVLILTIVLTVLTTAGESLLPTLLVGPEHNVRVENGVSVVVWLLSLVALLLLRPWRPTSVLNLWLGVVMFAWTLDVGASAVVAGTRFDLAYYAGRIYGLLAATFVLIKLLLDLGRLYERAAAGMEAEQRARVLGQIVEAQEQERHRIARELHDEMGTYLTAMKVRLDLLARRHGRAAVEGIESLLAQADHAVETLATELRPPGLDDLGVDGAIAQLAERFTSATGIPVYLHEQMNGGRLPPAVETTLYRVVQEALTNVGKHAQAKTVSVILDRRNDHVQLIVEDDGRGFDGSSAAPGATNRLGLLGIRERVRMVDGTLAIESTAGTGTSLFVRVPLAEVTP